MTSRRAKVGGLPRREEDPGSVRGMQTRGRGEKTEAGAGVNSFVWLLNRSNRRAAQPAQFLVRKNYCFARGAGDFASDAEFLGHAPYRLAAESEKHGRAAIVDLSPRVLAPGVVLDRVLAVGSHD